MNKMITTLNITFGIIATLWTAGALFVTIFLFDSPTATMLNRSGYLALVWSMPILTVLSIVLSRMSTTGSAVYLAWLPAVPLALGLIFLTKEMFSSHTSVVHTKTFVDAISKDYMCQKIPDHGADEFLTVNAERGVIVHITPYSTMTGADAVGKIDSGALRLFPYSESVRAERETLYKACLDKEGKSVYDRYTVSWDENGKDFAAYNLKQYETK